MAGSQGTMRGIVHHQGGGPLLDPKIEDVHDMGVFETRQYGCFPLKFCNIFWRDLREEKFDRENSPPVDMLSKIDLCKTALSKEAHETIVAELLPYTVSHTNLLTYNYPFILFSLSFTCSRLTWVYLAVV